MSFPSLKEVIDFIFRHDQWLEEQRVAKIGYLVERMARYHRLEKLTTVEHLLKHPESVLKDSYLESSLLYELDLPLRVEVDDLSHAAKVAWSPFPHLISTKEVVDWVVDRWRCGKPMSILVGPQGMTVRTDRGWTIKVPGCDIYLGRLTEDGVRYRNAVVMIHHLTGGAVDLDYRDLVGKTDRIAAERSGDGWAVDTNKF